MPARPLADLLRRTPHRTVRGDSSVEIAAVVQDSRRAAPGACFVAIRGERADGHAYIGQAIASGSVAIVVQADARQIWEPAVADSAAAVIEVDDTRAALADLAAAWHGFPAEQLAVVGVTGTDGKSTTTYLTHAILEAAGHRCGLINGVEFNLGGEWRRNETGETTPEAEVVQALLAEMAANGCTHAVIEASSHGLALQRVRNCNFDIGVFTGFSEDHLDFHGTREEYLEAKLSLFRSLGDAGGHARAVVRAEDEQRDQVAAATSRPTVLATASEAESADVRVQPLSRDAGGTAVRVALPSGALAARLPLPGDYNLGNLALAAAAAWTLGAGPVAIQRALSNLRQIPGRMEVIDEGQEFAVAVDAAATADALRRAIEAVRPLVEGRLLLVFGCAGERDPARRGGMGAVAADSADFTWITSENPRSEDPAAIVAEIAAAMRDAGAGARIGEEPDRRIAIASALAEAQGGDFVLIAGKGAEPTMIYADRTEPWDDAAVARGELRRLLSA